MVPGMTQHLTGTHSRDAEPPARARTYHNGAARTAMSELQAFLKRKFFLRYIAKTYHDNGGQHFGYRGIYIELFHEQFNKYIIHQDTNGYQQEIAKKLHPPMQVGILENNIPHQEKASWKTDAKSNNKGHDMRANGYRAQVYNLFLQDEIITDKKSENIEKRIRSATYDIPKSLQRQESSKGWMKKINNGRNKIRHAKAFFRFCCKANHKDRFFIKRQESSAPFYRRLVLVSRESACK